MKRAIAVLVALLALAILAVNSPIPELSAAPLRITLNCDANPDHVCDSGHPCLDGVTDCRSLNEVEWDTEALLTALAGIASQYVGTSTDVNLASYCAGVNCGSATYQLRAAVATWSVGGSGGSHLLNAGDMAGSSETAGALELQACYAGKCATAPSVNWSYQAGGGSDVTAPPIPVWLSQAGGGTGTATLEWQTVADASGNAVSSGMARYSIRNASTNAELDSLNAVGPGLLLAPTAYNIGSAPGTNTCVQSGLTWTISNAGGGLEAADQAEFCGAPVSGDFSAIGTVTSLPYLSDWAKVGFSARESVATDAAHATCYVMVSSYNWALQAQWRSVTGNDYYNTASLVLGAGPPTTPLPLRILLRRHGNLWDCAYSSDGQSWTYASRDREQPMTGTLLVGEVATPTSLGTQMSAQMQQVSISNSGRVSKTLTLSGPTSVAVRAIDGANNASANSASITLVPGSVSTGTAKKWHPGHYPWMYRSPQWRHDQAARFAYYDQFGGGDFIGFGFNSVWSTLEGATHGDYAAGDAMLLAEIAHLKGLAKPKRFMLMLDDEVYRGSTADYPAYLLAAGCVAEETWSGNNASARLEHFKYWIPACASFRADLIRHLGALLDSEPYFEGIILDYEQAYQNSLAASFAWPDFVAGVAVIAQAAAEAFPRTNVSWRENWGPQYHASNLVDLLAIMKTNHIGWGGEDSCSWNPVTWEYIQDGSLPSYIDADNVFAGWGGWDDNHQPGLYEDQRGKMYTNYGVEDSELGYNSVCGAYGATGLYYPAGNGDYFSLYNWWHDAVRASHTNGDLNQEIGISQQRYLVGVQYSLWDLYINTMTQQACPTDYDAAFGNGSPGSGCDTSN